MTMMLKFQDDSGEIYRIDPLHHLRFVFPQMVHDMIMKHKDEQYSGVPTLLRDLPGLSEQIKEGLKVLAKFPLASLDETQESASDCLQACGFYNLHESVRVLLMYYIGVAMTSTAWYVFRDCTEVGDKPKDLVRNESKNMEELT